MLKFKKGDLVLVIVGTEKGKIGRIEKLVRLKNNNTYQCKVLVKGVNLRKKNVRSDPRKGNAGGIVEKEMYIDVSNVVHVDHKNERIRKIGFFFDDAKVKVRRCKISGVKVG